MIGQDLIKRFDERFGRLERSQVKYRQGVVTDDSPFTVELGASGVSVPAVAAGAAPAAGETAHCLSWNNDLLVLGGVPAYVTSLPSSPANGQEVYYAADASNGVIWHLRYRSAASGSYKWEFVGGSALFATTSGTTTTSGSLTSISSPSITVPLSGDYRITFGFQGALFGATNGGSARAEVRIDGTATGAPCKAGTEENIGADGARYTDADRTIGPHTVVATKVVDIYGRVDGAGGTSGTAHFINQHLAVAPVRVG